VADWIWTESEGTTLEETPRVRVAQFGDGYQQRAPDGINDLVQTWTVPFDEVDDVIADEMVAFLRANRGRAFNYVPLWHTVAIKVVATGWTRTAARVGVNTLRVTFRQVFEP
jgi:phage-related protein